MKLVGRCIVQRLHYLNGPLIEPSRTASASVYSGGGARARARKLSSPPTAVLHAAEVGMALRLRSGAGVGSAAGAVLV